MKPLQITLTAAVACLIAVFVMQTWWFTSTDKKLCHVMHTLVARSGATVGRPGTPGYAYYHAHPDELKLAHQQNQRFLAELPCH